MFMDVYLVFKVNSQLCMNWDDNMGFFCVCFALDNVLTGHLRLSPWQNGESSSAILKWLSSFNIWLQVAC